MVLDRSRARRRLRSQAHGRGLGGALVGLTLIALAGCSSEPTKPATPPPAPGTKKPAAPDAPRFAIEKARTLDLTYSFGPSTLYWPTGEGFTRKDTSRGVTPAGHFYAAGEIAAAEHGGTHLDAPSHFAEKGAPVEAIPSSRLVGPAWVLDARGACAKDRDHLVSLDDLAAMERITGRVPDHAFVLVLTGWGRYWPSRLSYMGDDRRGSADALHFPGVDPALARELVARKVRAVGIDTASIDRGSSTHFETHRVLADAGVPAIENVAYLDALPATGSWVVAAPMKIEGGTGAPVRLIALAPEREAPLTIDAGPGNARRVADHLAAVAPTEAAIQVVDDAHVTAQIAPMFLGDSRREVDLEARLERAAFLVRFFLHEGPGAWNAPVWPLPKGHELEHGTPDERIARYEEPGRDAWQKPDEVVKALELEEDAVCVDVGSGSGYFARRLARAAPKGKTIGLDIEPRFVALVNDTAKKEKLALEARLVLSDDPGLAPSSVDVVLIVDTYHHLPDRKAYLAKLRAALRPNGRVVVIDFKKGSKMGPPDEHKLAKEKVLEEAKEAGLVLRKEHDLLPEQFFVELAAP